MKLVLLIIIALFTQTDAICQQQEFMINALSVFGLHPSYTPRTVTTNTFDVNLDPYKSYDIAHIKKIKDCYFTSMIAPMRLEDNTAISYWISHSPNHTQLEFKYKKYLLDIAALPNIKLKVMLADYDVYRYCRTRASNMPNFSVDAYPSNIFNYNDPNIFGIYLCDEPNTNSDFDRISNYIAHITTTTSWNLNNKPAFVNLLCSGGDIDNFVADGGTVYNSYDAYLDKAVLSNPTSNIISVDAYPFRYNCDTKVKTDNHFLTTYFYTLSRLKKKFSNKFLWSTINSLSNDSACVVDASESQMKFMAFCPIAYGFKGITYWAYSGTAYDLTQGKGLDEDLGKYNVAKKINRYIKDIVGPIVMSNKNIASLHSNDIASVNIYSSTENLPILKRVSNNNQPELIINDIEQIVNYNGIIKSMSADDILVGIFNNAPQNPCFVSSDLNNGSNYYLWVVNKETYANGGAGTTQNNMTITLRGRHDGLLGSTRALIYKGADAYNLSSTNALQNTLNPFYNATTNETTITIDVLNPGEGRMIKLYIANDIPIKPQAPKINQTGTYTYKCDISTNVVTYNWYVDNNLVPTIHTQSYTFINDNCPHQLYCTVTYSDCFIESIKSDPLLILGKKPRLCALINPCTSIKTPCLALARYSAATHPTIANTLTVGVKQLTQDELAKRFFDASALTVEKVQTVSVYNKAGELALEVTDIGTEVTNIDLSNLTEGVYTITVNGNNDYKEQQTFEYTVTKTPQQVQEELAIDNTAIAGTDQEKATEVLQEELYQKLKENTDLLENSATLQSFFLNKEQGSFGTIEKINDALSNYDVTTAQNLINVWLPTSNLELNCLTYYNNFIKYLNGGTFTTSDVNDLYSLANLCPQKNGEVIYAARSLYNYIANDNDEFPNACGNNTARNIVRIKANTKQQTSNIILYPNPSKGNFNIAFPSNTKGINTINVLDMYGRSVLQQKTIGGIKNININQSLAKGIYIVQITNSVTAKVETLKICIESE